MAVANAVVRGLNRGNDMGTVLKLEEQTICLGLKTTNSATQGQVVEFAAASKSGQTGGFDANGESGHSRVIQVVHDSLLLEVIEWLVMGPRDHSHGLYSRRSITRTGRVLSEPARDGQEFPQLLADLERITFSSITFDTKTLFFKPETALPVGLQRPRLEPIFIPAEV